MGEGGSETAHSLFGISGMSQKGRWAVSILITLMGNPCQQNADELPRVCAQDDNLSERNVRTSSFIVL